MEPANTRDSRILHDAALQQQARKIADIVFEYFATGASHASPYLEDRRRETPNSFYNQTAQGFFLELYYGLPSKLWTPWGTWGFGGSGSSAGNEKALILPKLIERFGATVHTNVRYSEMGEHGPVYALRRIDDVTLPEPVELMRSAYASYEEAHDTWKRLNASNPARQDAEGRSPIPLKLPNHQANLSSRTRGSASLSYGSCLGCVAIYIERAESFLRES